MKLSLIIFAVLMGCSYAFECYTCNHKPEDDDSKPCEDQVETCSAGVTSCSMIFFMNLDGKEHTRKFCTSSGTAIYQHLLFFPGSALCQNIDTANAPQPPPPPPMKVKIDNGSVITVNPPAPPQEQKVTLLCVCTKELCNGGSYLEVMNENLLQNMESEENKDENENEDGDEDEDEDEDENENQDEDEDEDEDINENEITE